MLLERASLVIEDSLRLLDLLHVVLHLILEIALEEVKQVVLDVDFLDLAVDSLKLSVDLVLFHSSETAQLFTHLHDLILLLVLAVQLALLVDLLDNLRLDEIQFKVDLY